MKKFQMLLTAAVISVLLASCGGGDAAPEVTESEAAAPAVAEGMIAVDNAFYYDHINGHGKETPTVAFVLYEYEQLETVKYQVAYIACTCRGPEVNYYSVAYVELSKEDGSIAFISYDKDSTDHYTAGMYGDSTETWDGTPAKELFARFQEEVLMGASQDAINAMEPMHGDVDTYSGATVTPNNAVRMLQKLFIYHNNKY